MEPDHCHEGLEEKVDGLTDWQRRQNGTLTRVEGRVDDLHRIMGSRMDRMEMMLNAKLDNLELKLTSIELRNERRDGQRSTAFAIIQWFGPMGLATILIAIFSYFNVF